MSQFSKFSWGNSAAGKAIGILTPSDRVKLLWIALVQVLMGFLDLIGVVALGGLGALSIQGIETHAAGNKVSILLRILNIDRCTFQTQVAILGISSATILITKTILSIFFTRRTFFFLSSQSAKISANLISRVLSQNLIQIQARTSQETLYIITEGVRSLMLGVLATCVTIAADLSLLLIMAIGLMFVDFGVAFSTFLLFGLMGVLLYRLLQVRAKELGSESAKLTIESNEKILEVLNSYRESVVRNRRQFYSNRIGEMRYALGEMIAETTFLPYISKYVIESITVLGSLLLASFEFGTKNAVHAVAVLAVFLAASSRIAPAALRIQQGILQIRSSTGSAQSTLQLIAQVEDIAILDDPEVHSDFQYQGFVPSITIENLNFSYPALNQFALSDINLEVNPGMSVAVVGPSGVGKTTLIDLILGVLHPASGSVAISGVTPEEASKRWPGAISYVPQNIVIASGTIRENVSLGYPKILADDTRVTQALEIAKLSEVVSSLEGGLDAYVGEQGSKLSGGQRQRLGIARALFTGPRLLVLDEATSALDSQTEADISQAIYSLRGKVTILIVAHRLSTVRSADKVIYLNGGRIEAVGSFEEVRALVPDFDKQADLMGL